VKVLGLLGRLFEIVNLFEFLPCRLRKKLELSHAISVGYGL